MSSIAVRQEFLDFITANIGSEKLVELETEFTELQDVLDAYAVPANSAWTGINFIGNDELPVTTPATNDQGRYRETGAVYIHIVGLAVFGVRDSILQRGEALRTKLRGMRLGRVIIESVTPLNFQAGATLQFEGTYTAGSFIVSYQFDTDL